MASQKRRILRVNHHAALSHGLSIGLTQGYLRSFQPHALNAYLVAFLVGMTVLINAPHEAYAKEVRCGWIVNPTPANWTLLDADCEWVLGTQGAFQAKGLEDIGDLTASDWVVTNGSSYGYGCACLTVDTERATKTVTQIHSFRQLKLAKCEADKNLPRL